MRYESARFQAILGENDSIKIFIQRGEDALVGGNLMEAYCGL